MKKDKYSRKFGEFFKQKKLPTGVGNWWIEFNGQPISFEVLDGNVNFLNEMKNAHPEWEVELIGRFIILPNLEEITTTGDLEIKCDVPKEMFQEVDIISDEWNTGQQFQMIGSAKSIDFGVAQYFDDHKKTKLAQQIFGSYGLDSNDIEFPSYFIENTQNLNDLRFVIAWGKLLHPDSLCIDFACDFIPGMEIEAIYE